MLSGLKLVDKTELSKLEDERKRDEKRKKKDKKKERKEKKKERKEKKKREKQDARRGDSSGSDSGSDSGDEKRDRREGVSNPPGHGHGKCYRSLLSKKIRQSGDVRVLRWILDLQWRILMLSYGTTQVAPPREDLPARAEMLQGRELG